jgi:hypothetical protein
VYISGSRVAFANQIEEIVSMPTIRVDEEVFQAIKDRAEPLKDSPNTTLRSVFGLESTPEKVFSFEARLRRLGKALKSGRVTAAVRNELASIRSAYNVGTFGKDD